MGNQFTSFCELPRLDRLDENQFTSFCELPRLDRLVEDDGIHNVNDEQEEEEELEREQNECDALYEVDDY